MVKVTYGHGNLQECDVASDWGSATNSADPLSSVSLAVQNGDYMRITGTCDNAADEWVYYELDITNISTDTYGDFVLRYRTSASSAGLGAKAILIFTSGSQVLTGANPVYSTDWTVLTGATTASKTIDKIRFYADDYPNSVAAGEFWVEYDFLLLAQDIYSLPASGTEVRFTFPPRLPILEIPGASGDITQNLGSRLATVNMRNPDMLVQSGWKRSSNPTDVSEGEVFIDIWHNMKDEPWQWLTGFLPQGKGGMKATLDREPSIAMGPNGYGFDVTFREKRAASAANETYVERLGLNL